MISPRQEVRVELATEVLRSTGVVRLRVSGRSMFPWIRPEDVLSIRRAEWHQLSSGNVVVFARAGQFVVHRVIRKGGTAGQPFLVTKGDAVMDEDAPVCVRELLGCVTAIHRGSRWIKLESPARRALGWLLACVSAKARRWYPAARAAIRWFRPRLEYPG